VTGKRKVNKERLNVHMEKQEFQSKNIYLILPWFLIYLIYYNRCKEYPCTGSAFCKPHGKTKNTCRECKLSKINQLANIASNLNTNNSNGIESQNNSTGSQMNFNSLSSDLIIEKNNTLPFTKLMQVSDSLFSQPTQSSTQSSSSLLDTFSPNFPSFDVI